MNTAKPAKLNNFAKIKNGINLCAFKPKGKILLNVSISLIILGESSKSSSEFNYGV